MMVQTDRSGMSYTDKEDEFIEENYGDMPSGLIAERLGRTKESVIERASVLRRKGRDVDYIVDNSGSPEESTHEEKDEEEETSAENNRDTGSAILLEADEGTISKLEEVRKHFLATQKLMIGLLDEGVKKIALIFMVLFGIMGLSLAIIATYLLTKLV